MGYIQRKVKIECIFLLIILFFEVNCQQLSQTPSLQKYNADISQTSVSGISAGAYMAAQFQVAFSQNIVGSGIVAGGPFLCAEGQVSIALTSCMNSPLSISLNTLYKKAQNLDNIDDLSNLKDKKVYIYDGTYDSVVKPGVGKAGGEWFSNYNADLKTVYDVPSQHAWITNNYGNDCNKLESPYMNNCDYDQSNDILSWIYGTLNPPVPQISSNLLEFNQNQFTKFGDSMGDIGFVYVPTSCQKGDQVCKVHVAFHGCKMTLADIGTDFVVKTGLNEIAESNNIIVLYPQIKKSLVSPSNPNGCFDWWGYTCNSSPLTKNLTYATQKGLQMEVVYSMILKITSGFSSNQLNQSVLDQ